MYFQYYFHHINLCDGRDKGSRDSSGVESRTPDQNVAG